MFATWSITNVLALLLLLAVAVWIGYHWLQKSEEPGRLIAKWIGSALILYFLIVYIIPAMLTVPIVGVPVAVLLLLILGVTWAGDMSRFAASILTDAIDGGSQEIEPHPCYSAAETKRARGQYREAIEEVRRQLEKFPTDTHGLMMLAQIQAEHLNDLESAVNTVERLLQQKGHTIAENCGVLHQLADWHLRFGMDPDSARAALERISELFPDTHQAQVAAERIAHLPTLEHLTQSRQRPGIVLKPFAKDLGLAGESPLKPRAEPDPADTAAQYVRHLDKHPMDIEARENLALLYADHFHRPEMGIEQLDYLLALPSPSQRNVARWLNLLADIQVKYQNDVEAARKTLQQIAQRFPDSAVAQNAQTRLTYLNLETRSKQTSQPIRLGSYQKDLGLKKQV